jgi:hypothetical protein
VQPRPKTITVRLLATVRAVPEGVVASVAEAAHPRRGPLGGRYTLLRDGAVERPLLQKWTLEEWEVICGFR